MMETTKPTPEAWRKKSSLRNILSDYGMPEDLQKSKENSSKKPKDPKRKQNESFGGDYDNDREKAKREPKRKQNESFGGDYDNDRENAKRERNLHRYDEVQKMRALYYKVYLNKMKEKVELQRQLIQKQSEENEMKLRKQEQKEKQESHHMKRRLQRHMLDHDDDFVRRVPKSDNYKIVALQDKLKAQGMLKTQEDCDIFWNDVKDPATLRKYLFIYKPLPSESSTASNTHPGSTYAEVNPSHRSRTSSMTSHPPQEAVPPEAPDLPIIDNRPLTRIQESRESSRPVTREHTTMSKERSDNKQQLEPHVVAKMAAAELERRCPAMELPPMSCFTMNFGDEPQDAEEVLAELCAERRQKERRLFVKRLRRMYHLSSSNVATAQRILSHHVDDSTDFELANPRIGDIIAVDEITRDIDKTLSLQGEPSLPPNIQHPWRRYVEIERRKSILPIQEEWSDATDSATSLISSSSRAKSAENKTEPPRSISPVPLSLGSMPSKIMEAKCMSSLWNNYLDAGQSKFSPVNT